MESEDDDTLSTAFSNIELDDPNPKSDYVLDFMDSKTRHDRVLVVSEVQLFVISQILMLYSNYFKVLFGEKFKNSQTEPIELHEVMVDEFIELLKHLYSHSRDITVVNVVSLMNLSDRFLIPSLFSKCVEFVKLRCHLPFEKEHEPFASCEGEMAIFGILRIAIRLDLEVLKIILKERVFISSKHLRCKVCKQRAVCSECGSHGRMNVDPDVDGLLLPSDHICVKYRDYIMTLEPEDISFIFQSLIMSAYASTDSKIYDELEILKGLDKTVAGRKPRTFNRYAQIPKTPWIITPPVYDFTNPSNDHDCIIVVEDQKHYVNSEVVCNGAKWFCGRLKQGCELLIPDISSLHLRFLLKQLYGTNDHKFEDDFNILLVLVNLAARFEAPDLLRQGMANLQNTKIDDCVGCKEKLRLADIASKYNLRNLKKLFYLNCGKKSSPLYCGASCGAVKKFKCQSTEKSKGNRHEFKMDGKYFNSEESVIIFGRKGVYEWSEEMKRFLLSCLLGNVASQL